MAPEQTIRTIRAQDLTLRCTMSPPRDMTGWTITFKVQDALAGTDKITKTVGSGVTITDGPRGIITIALAKADTSGLTVTTSLAAGKGYVWEIKRTTSGSNLVLARGQLILEQEVVA
jgi:hypothetical protein